MKPFINPSKAILSFSITLLCIGYVSSSGAKASALTDNNEKKARQNENIVFGVIGDYGSGEAQEADVANLVKSWNPDFIVTVGDNNYPIGAAYAIDENIGQFYHEFIYPYNGKYGAGAAYKRFFPALGNHDWMSNGAVPYFNYFSFYNHKGYYDFVQGPAHFFILDSDANEPDGTTSNSKQAKWLKNGLAASTSSFNIVVMHHPPYSSGTHGSTSDMQWPFKAWGADAILSGHDHLYERVLVDGLPYFVDGIGGEDIYGFGTIVSGSQVRFNQDFGAIRVEANNTTMKFQAITRAGVLVDEYTISNGIPIVTSISRAAPNPSNASSVDYIVNFSESVAGVDASDFNLTTNINSAFISNVSGSASTYTVSVNTGSSDGDLRLDLIDNDSIINTSGKTLGDLGVNNANFTTGESYTVDKTFPTVTSIARENPSPSNALSVDFSVIFSESVSGVDTSDFNLTSSAPEASINSVSGSGNVYTVSVNTGAGDDTLRLNTIDDDSISDAASNKLGGIGTSNGNFVTGESYTIDKSIPTVTSIIRASPNPNSAPQVDFVITFSEPITGLDTSDFNLTTTNITGASIIGVENHDPFYIISVNTGIGTGTLRLDFTDDDSVADRIGNKAGGIGPGNGNFSGGEIYEIDKSIPTVISILRANPDPTSATGVDFAVTFSDSVTGVDTSDFSLTTNVNDASITNINGSGNTYIISVNTGSNDGTLQLNLLDDDSIINDQGNMLGGVGLLNGNFTSGETYTIYKSIPWVTSIIRASPNPSGNSSIDFIVTFSESVTGVDLSDFGLTANGISNASILSVTNVDPFYIVTVNTGLGTGTLRLDLIDDDSIADSAGNKPGGPGVGNGNFTTGESYTVSKASINFPPPSIRGFRQNFLTNNPTPSFAWTIVRGARIYEIIIASDSNFTQIVTSQILNALSYTASPQLSDGIYYWHVRAYNSGLQPGRFSYSQSFTVDTTPPPAPVLISPVDNAIISTKPTFIWTKLDSATSYHIEIDNNSDFSSPEFNFQRNDPSYRVSGLRKGIYFWQVQAKDAAGNWGNWSTRFTFNIP